MKTLVRLTATLLAGALLAACSDSPTAPGAPDAGRQPSAAPALALSGGIDSDPIEGPITATVRVENHYFNSTLGEGYRINGFEPSEFAKRELTNVKVRFSVQNAHGVTLDSKDVVDNSAADLDKRVNYFKVSMAAAGRTLKATLLTVDAPFTTVGAYRVHVVDDQVMNLGKLLVNRLPVMSMYIVYWKYPNTATTNSANVDPPSLGSYTIAGPNGYFLAKQAAPNTFWKTSAVVPGAYTVCRKAPAGYTWEDHFLKSACDTTQIAYNTLSDVFVLFYPLN